MFDENILEGKFTPIAKQVDFVPAPIEYTLDGEAIAWPIDANGLFQLYQKSGYHSRCCQIKSETAFGIGIDENSENLLKPLMPKGTGVSGFFVELGLDLEAYGNAFVEKIYAGSTLVGLKRIPARTVFIREQGGLVQWDYKVDGTIEFIRFPEENFLQLSQPCPAGFHYSLPQWIGAENMLELAIAATIYNAAFFQNHAMPSYAIKVTGGKISDKVKSAIKSFFQNDIKGIDNAHKTIFIPLTGKTEINFEKLSENIKDMDFEKMLNISRDNIVSAHGVPPRMLGIMAAGQLGGGGEVSAQLHVFEAVTLQPRRRRMAEQFSEILVELGSSEPMTFSPMDITPPGEDSSNIPSLVSSGIITPEEGREIFLQKGGAALQKKRLIRAMSRLIFGE